MSNRSKPLNVEVRDGMLIVEIGIDTLRFAAEFGAARRSDEHNDPIYPMKISDPDEFAKDVGLALEDEAEDGATHRGLARQVRSGGLGER